MFPEALASAFVFGLGGTLAVAASVQVGGLHVQPLRFTQSKR
jgi:hypothetical protein